MSTEHVEALQNENAQLRADLAKVQSNFDLLFNQMNSAFALCKMIYDDEGSPIDYQYVKVNNEFEKITGLSAADVNGKNARTLMPNIEQYWLDAFGEVASSGEPKDMEDFFRELGKYFGVRAFSPEKGYFATTFIDITQRKLAEMALSDNEELFRNIFEQAASGICIYSTEGRFLKLNSKFSDILGYTEKELLRMSIDEITYKADSEKVEPLFKKIVSQEKNTYSVEKRLVSKEGSNVWVNSYVAPVVNKDGSVKFVINIVNEITDKKNAEKKLKASYKQIRQINYEMNKAKAKAEESDRLKSAFLANMSHEIRTPMNGIVGFINMLSRPNLPEAKQKSYINVIQTSCNQLLHIVNDIVDISKIEAGQIEIKKEKFNLNALFRDVYDFYLPAAKEKGIDFFIKLGDTDSNADVLTDPSKIRQILNNLMNNAFKFTEEGNVTLEYKLNSSAIEFFVIDTGIGIGPEHIDVIFDRFRQAETSLSRGYGGTGLGLSISKAYIEKLGGKIGVRSELGKGTVFKFFIPLEDRNARILNELRLNYMDVFKDRPTVLVTEDEEINFLLIEELLEEFNINLLHAKNGKQAIEMCEENAEIKLVLMDIKLPGMNGYEAAEKIKEFRPELPIIAQTAYALNGDKEKALESGCDDYIAKPIDTTAFIHLMEKYM